MDINLDNIQTILIAAACGALLGTEREIAGKPAGIRTHIFVCIGSALMMILGHAIVNQFQQQEVDSLLSVDPIRTLQAIVVGISFLGAGTIIHQKDEGVEGLTTAATIFLTAGIGVATAVGQVSLAVFVTVFAVFVLVLVGFIERKTENRKHRNDPTKS
ncbi:putative Mg(2+) transport ATPase [Novipirellula aureliae]|uniref:Putative Mg(2+) transport ATPase n=1 Tax=Novipirellula aureliae TaxID=2527966 RepID=A0A5C6E741_9BACT|nr:MgtC/SapB family protein [Novipirellula aureliae]TWU44404.1 putative Mg(2+) transport ATPase [Novipirellula aureliae]